MSRRIGLRAGDFRPECCPGDLLVVGAGRRGALVHIVGGRVSRYCLAHARCPVLTVPPPPLAQETR